MRRVSLSVALLLLAAAGLRAQSVTTTVTAGINPYSVAAGWPVWACWSAAHHARLCSAPQAHLQSCPRRRCSIGAGRFLHELAAR
jgi:hypothetical protein